MLKFVLTKTDDIPGPDTVPFFDFWVTSWILSVIFPQAAVADLASTFGDQ